ncbi:hypothetical protein MCAP1_002751 [Malassezia caprae]|uniref:CUE domain-containing protein n=1 Tax=Malassezia caprae TaxID=1381934 RepID=A0AAF0E7X1_9BASI|nr:hypothetical protein MCAP1_002751 [Malassezia caprae]
MGKRDMKKEDEAAQNAQEDVTHAETDEGVTNESAQTEVEHGPGADASESSEKGADAMEKAPAEPSKENDPKDSQVPNQDDSTENEATTRPESSASTQPHPSTPQSVGSHDAQLEQLQSMFPAFHEITVSDIFKARRYNMESGPPPPLPSRTPELSVWPTSDEARQWKEDFNRFTEETALRQHEGSNRMNSPGFFRHRTPTSHGSNLFQQDAYGRTNGNTWSSGSIYRTAPMYDNDPKPVADEELESLVGKTKDQHTRASQEEVVDPSPPPRLPSKDRISPEKLATPTKSTVPAWGQRYSNKGQSTASEAKSHAHGSKSVPPSKQEDDVERSSEPKELSQSSEAPTSDTPGQEPPNNSNDSVNKGENVQPSTQDDDDFVENPFDDDD